MLQYEEVVNLPYVKFNYRSNRNFRPVLQYGNITERKTTSVSNSRDHSYVLMNVTVEYITILPEKQKAFCDVLQK